MSVESRRRDIRILETAGAAAAFAAAFVANYYAGRYVDRVAGRLPALEGDLLLQVLPRVDLTVLFVWGFAAFLAFAGAAAYLYERDRIFYIAWMYAILIAIRAFFLILTPMGAPAGAFPVEGSALFDMIGNYMTFKNDLFFSAHTSMPFLGYLIYRARWVRGVFLGLSFALASCVLLSRLHYSIDVAGAFFITSGVAWTHRALIEPIYRSWKKNYVAGRRGKP
ncbi:MAG: phosphatase PAP2-related protein [Elusimicrobiota bacterium]